MTKEDGRELVEALKAFARDAKDNVHDSEELRVKRAQLQAIQRTIRQLERKGIPVPDGFNGQKLSLVSEVAELEKGSGSCQEVYEALLDVVESLGRTCQRRPSQELYLRRKEWRQQSTSPEDLRQAIVKALKELDGSAHERDILGKVGQLLASRLTDADREKLRGRHPRWQSNARRERKRMIDDGILTPDSRRSRWTLAK